MTRLFGNDFTGLDSLGLDDKDKKVALSTDGWKIATEILRGESVRPLEEQLVVMGLASVELKNLMEVVTETIDKIECELDKKAEKEGAVRVRIKRAKRGE